MQESRRCDWASLAYHVGTMRKLQNAFDGVVSAVEDINPSISFELAGKSQFYDYVYESSNGWRIELSHPESGSPNQGQMLVTCRGRAFWQQSQIEQAAMLRKLFELRAFKYFNRLDFQNTELHPEWDADRVFRGVRDGELWVSGFSGWDVRGGFDYEMNSLSGRTLTWGSQRADRLYSTYDKGVQSGWKGPGIRDEVRLKGAWARAYGVELIKKFRKCHTSAEMEEQMQRIVEGALNKHGQYWQLNGANPKQDKNWKRKAEPADWFAKRIGKASSNVTKKKPEEVRDLETVTAYGVQQYGRYFSLWVTQIQQTMGCSRIDAWRALEARFDARLKDEDLEWIQGLFPDADGAAVAESLNSIRDLVAAMNEHDWGSPPEAKPKAS